MNNLLTHQLHSRHLNIPLHVDPFRLQLVGIRNLSKLNYFDDELHYYYYDYGNVLHHNTVTKFTTDPGKSSLESPVHPKGCAILKEGYHKDLWKVGYHKGKYKALVQANPVTVYRDNNKDLVCDLSNEHTGLFGINLHRANASVCSNLVGGWSAGCQVVADPNDYADLMKVVDICVSYGQKYFSYLLMNGEDE